MDLLSSIGLVVVLTTAIIAAAWGWTKWSGRRSAGAIPRPDYERQVLGSLRRIEILLAILAAALLVRLLAW